MWSAPPGGPPGATPGSCEPASGSTFPLFSSTVTCQVLDAYGDVATATFQVNVTPTTQFFTRVVLPADGATLAGAPYLDALAADAPGVTNVVFELSGGPSSLSDQVIATATPTYYGWLAKWNTTSVPNGTYTLQSVATDADNNSDTSTPVSITVDNPLPAPRFWSRPMGQRCPDRPTSTPPLRTPPASGSGSSAGPTATPARLSRPP